MSAAVDWDRLVDGARSQPSRSASWAFSGR